MITTTLNRIKRAGFLAPLDQERLLKGLGKAEADDEPLPFAQIVEINGLEDALRCCNVEPQYEREWRLFVVWCCRRVEHWMTDQRSRDALAVAERYAHGKTTKEELAKARRAAEAAAADAADAAREAVASVDAAHAARAACAAAEGPARVAYAGVYVAALAARAEGGTRWAMDAALSAQTAAFLRIVTETEARA